jgi:hypothetical protein
MQIHQYYILFLSIFFWSLELPACSCSGYSVDLPLVGKAERVKIPGHEDEAAGKNNIFFLGRVIKIDQLIVEHENKTVYHYQVIDKYGSKINDTLRIFTNAHADACGWADVLDGLSFITAYRRKNQYHTLRTHCIQSVSNTFHPKRFKQWLLFLESIHSGKDGRYEITQAERFRFSEYDSIGFVPAATYTIIDGKLSGEYLIYNRKQDTVEMGNYRSGQKVGVWLMPRTYLSDNFEYVVKEKTQVYFDKNKITRVYIDRKIDYSISDILREDR